MLDKLVCEMKKNNNVAAQVVLQNYMFECFLARLSKSEYRDKFVVNGYPTTFTVTVVDQYKRWEFDMKIRLFYFLEEHLF